MDKLKGGEKETNKKTIASFILITVLAFSLGLTINTLNSKTRKITADLYLYDGSGAGAQLIAQKQNLITDLGENATLFSLNDANQTLLAISTGNETAIDQTDTQLTSEATTDGFDRVAANVSAYWFNSGDIAINYTALFRATDTISVNAVGLHWSVTDDSDNNMYAASHITDGTQHQFPSAGELTAVWVITVNAN